MEANRLTRMADTINNATTAVAAVMRNESITPPVADTAGEDKKLR